MPGKFLDDVGLKRLWEKIRTSFGFKVDGTLTVRENVLGVSQPVKGPINKEDYDKLSDDEKKSLYIVDEPEWTPTTLEIQEYDQTASGVKWHVRKWSNGYVEFVGLLSIAGVHVDGAFGTLYESSAQGPYNLPFNLEEKYNEQATIIKAYNPSSSGAAGLFLYTFSRTESTSQTSTYCLARPKSGLTSLTVKLSFYITGRWK